MVNQSEVQKTENPWGATDMICVYTNALSPMWDHISKKLQKISSDFQMIPNKVIKIMVVKMLWRNKSDKNLNENHGEAPGVFENYNFCFVVFKIDNFLT